MSLDVGLWAEAQASRHSQDIFAIQALRLAMEVVALGVQTFLVVWVVVVMLFCADAVGERCDAGLDQDALSGEGAGGPPPPRIDLPARG